MHGHPEVAERLIREGFECHVEHLVGICRPCGAGTYGGKGSEGCFECPPGKALQFVCVYFFIFFLFLLLREIERPMHEN